MPRKSAKSTKREPTRRSGRLRGEVAESPDVIFPGKGTKAKRKKRVTENVIMKQAVTMDLEVDLPNENDQELEDERKGAFQIMRVVKRTGNLEQFLETVSANMDKAQTQSSNCMLTNGLLRKKRKLVIKSPWKDGKGIETYVSGAINNMEADQLSPAALPELESSVEEQI